MAPAWFHALRAYLRKTSGLVLDTDKAYLAENRLQAILRRENLSGMEELVLRLERGGSARLAYDVMEAMTVNETYFFRDKVPFSKFRDVMLPHLIARRSHERRLRIWSAACSSGQEPYSLALILADAAPMLRDWTIEILGTDLSEAVLEKARAGLYEPFEVKRGLPDAFLSRFFQNTGKQWRISKPIRDAVTFRRFNLLDDFSSLGRFDVIFCRNVLIYFDVERKIDVFARLGQALLPDGYLVLGACESILATSGSPFRALADGPGIFQRPAAAASTAGVAPLCAS